jgi:hypothetical protein
MGRLTDPLAVRGNFLGRVPPAFGMIPDAGNSAPSAALGMHPPTHLVRFTKRNIGAGIVASEDKAVQDRALRTVSVPLGLEWFVGRIRMIQIDVIDLDDLTEEIRLDGYTIGFISRAGRIFVAQTGTRLDRAEECGQCLLWDKAAAILVTLLGRLPEPEEPDPRMGAPQHTTGHHDGGTGQTPKHQPPRVYELSRSGDHKW